MARSPREITTATDIAGTNRCHDCNAFLADRRGECGNCGADL